MKRKKWSIVKLLTGFMNRVSGDHVGAYATQSAYFLILSFIPCILFLTTLVRYTPLTYNVVRDAIIAFIPENLQSFVLGIVVDVYKRSTAIVPLSALVALWSAGKGLQSIINGLNTIYHVKETRNWLLTRIYAVFYTLCLVIALVVSLLMLVLGNEIQKALSRYLPFLAKLMGKILGARAFIIAVAWSVFSYGFSFYFEIFPGFSNMYGNLATIIMVMLWLYFCMNLLLYGAEINAYFENEFRLAHRSVKGILAHEKERIQSAKISAQEAKQQEVKLPEETAEMETEGKPKRRLRRRRKKSGERKTQKNGT